MCTVANSYQIWYECFKGCLLEFLDSVVVNFSILLIFGSWSLQFGSCNTLKVLPNGLESSTSTSTSIHLLLLFQCLFMKKSCLFSILFIFGSWSLQFDSCSTLNCGWETLHILLGIICTSVLSMCSTVLTIFLFSNFKVSFILLGFFS